MNSNYTPGKIWSKIFKKPKSYQYYDLLSPHQDIDKTEKFFKKYNVKTILDIGCGMGNNLFYLSERGYQISGIDASETSINKVRKKASKLNKKINVELANFEKLPYKNNSFDAIISVQTLNHSYEKNITLAISEIKRVLKPNGVIFITLPGRISKGKVRYCLVKTAKKVADHTYIPTVGDEMGVPHIIYNKNLLNKHYKGFQFVNLWKDDKDYYCFFAINS